MERAVHEVYYKPGNRTVCVYYDDEGYDACMDFFNRNGTDVFEYFRTEEENFLWHDRARLVNVVVYAETTGQFTEDELDDDNTIEIPVPVDLLYEWWLEGLEFDREQCPECEPEGGWGDPSIKDMYRWLYEDSIADETYNLYDWLVEHNYVWKRID